MKTTAERQREWRSKRKADGYQMITVWLDPDVAEKMDKVIEKADKKQAERQRLINQALKKIL